MKDRTPSLAAAGERLAARRDRFLSQPGVEGVGVGLRGGRLAFILTLASEACHAMIQTPDSVDGLPVHVEVACGSAKARR